MNKNLQQVADKNRERHKKDVCPECGGSIPAREHRIDCKRSKT